MMVYVLNSYESREEHLISKLEDRGIICQHLATLRYNNIHPYPPVVLRELTE